VDWGFAAGLGGGAAIGAALAWLWAQSHRRPPGPSPDATATGLARPGLDALQVGVLVLDRQDRPVLANPAATRMGLALGRPGGEASRAHPSVRTLAGQVRRGGTRLMELDLPRTDADGADHGSGAGRGDAAADVATAADGGRDGREPLALSVRGVPLGEGYIAVEAADATEIHRVARIRRDFVANVSHELKTPVGALQLLAEALLDATDTEGATPPDPAAAHRFAERIRHESNRLGRLVSELLELSRLQGGEPPAEPKPVSVDRIVAEVVDRTRTPAAAKQITVRAAGLRGLTVHGNESQLVTAVANLVDNAIAYSPESTQVHISARGDAETVEIAVTDEGIGIEPRDQDRIFERFYRADRARSRSTGGTGLGLAIVKHIATNHGGRVDVTSTVGVGSTFTLRLPARWPDVAAAQPSPDGIEAVPGA
jgi:two-component system, OmpR family, sensor histidine kinase SenX3